MMLHLPPNGPLEDRDRLILRLRSLLADLERIESGWRPTSRDLASAPRLDDWQLAQRPAPCLVGVAEGHPTIRGGRRTLTSDLWLLAPEHGFARTLSRFYRLGEAEGCD